MQRVLMHVSPEFPTVTQARFLFVGVMFLVLMAIAHGAAELKGWLDTRGPAVSAHTLDFMTCPSPTAPPPEIH